MFVVVVVFVILFVIVVLVLYMWFLISDVSMYKKDDMMWIVYDLLK